MKLWNQVRKRINYILFGQQPLKLHDEITFKLQSLIYAWWRQFPLNKPILYRLGPVGLPWPQCRYWPIRKLHDAIALGAEPTQPCRRFLRYLHVKEKQLTFIYYAKGKHCTYLRFGKEFSDETNNEIDLNLKDYYEGSLLYARPSMFDIIISFWLLKLNVSMKISASKNKNVICHLCGTV